jgi:hypothetical protein
MYCTGLNSKGSSCGNTVAHGKYCAWHVPESKVDKRTKPASKKKSGVPKPVSKKKSGVTKPVSKKKSGVTKPVSKKTQGTKPVSTKTTSKTIQQQAHEIQQIVYMDKAHNPSQHAIVNEVTIAVYGHLFPNK